MSRRILTFDLLRGWCLFIIACDHLDLHPALFDFVTGKSLLWVTAAEGFFFISGLLAGLIRRRDAEKNGFEVAAGKLWTRAGKLYVATAALTIVFSYIAYFLTGKGINGSKTGLVDFGSFWPLLIHALSFDYVYGWADFLHYYAVYMVLAPLALWLLRRNKLALLLAVSTFLWLIKAYTGDTNLHSYLIWQLYFFGGMATGYHFDNIRGYYQSFSGRRRKQLRYSLTLSAALTIVVSLVMTFLPTSSQDNGNILHSLGLGPLLATPSGRITPITNSSWYNLLFQDGRSGLLRPVFFLLWFGVLFMITRRYEAFLLKWLGKFLVPLGENSLYVYIIEGALIFAVPFLHLPLGFVANTLIDLAVVAIAWILVKRRFLFWLIPR